MTKKSQATRESGQQAVRLPALERSWQTPAIYPHARIAEFAATAERELLCSVDDIRTYVLESEHQDGEGWLDNFSTLGEILSDFRLYLRNIEEA